MPANKVGKLAEADDTVKEKATRTEPAEKAAEPKFTVKKMRSHCIELFGVSSSTFDGAMHGHDGQKEYTIGECRAIISKWLGKEK